MTPFVKDAAERAAKTFAQAVIAYFGAGALDVLHADWGNAFSVGLGATVLSLLSSVASFKVGHTGTASLTDAVEPAGRHSAL